MPSIGQTTRPGYVYDSATDTWIPIGIGPHTHASTDLSGVIANSIVDAKADLITATADNTPARIAVGTNGTVLTANSSTVTGLEWTSIQTLSNPVINGGMDVWQRGTSFVGSGTAFGPDRWQAYRSTTGSTFSRQNTSDTTNLPSIQYCVRASRDSGNTSTNNIACFTNMESVNSIPFAGKTITLSFYARRGANFSGASNIMISQIYQGTGTDQNLLSGYTNQSIIDQNNTLTTTWQRFTQTITANAATTQFGLNFYYTPTGTAGANDWFEVTGVQLDVGTYTAATAPTFRRSGGTIAGELAACQRYLPFVSAGTESYGYCYATNSWVFSLPFPTMARVEPTGIVLNTSVGNYTIYNQANTQIAPSAIAFNVASGTNSGSIIATATGTTGSVGRIRLANSIGAIYFTGCEL